MKTKPIKILFLTAEIAPLAKVGGLGDVLGALPKAIGKDKAEIRMCLPFYGSIDAKKTTVKLLAENLKIPVYGKQQKFSLYSTLLPGTKIPVYLINHRLFSKKEIYSSGKGRFDSGNAWRFAFFTRASLEASKFLKFSPDIIHCHDWHSALAPAMIKSDENLKSFFSQVKFLFTIHNLANQGKAKPEIIRAYGLTTNPVKVDVKNKDLNFMVQGILGADLVNTVSPAYAKEILTPELGAGLNKILLKRKKSLSGILNGIDTDAYNPKNDKYLSFQYSESKLGGKENNKLVLQKKLGWKTGKKICLIGVVTRLVWQKGLDLFTENLIKQINSLQKPWQIVFLGAGEKKYETGLKKLEKKYPNTVKTILGFDEKLAHEIYAASDIFLVPSRFEPCGLTQMIAMRYGSVPAVRATGGLIDTVNKSVGFSFKKYTSDDLAATLIKALNVYYNKPTQWKKLQINGMKKDFSWKKSAKEYMKLYNRLIS